MDETTVFLTIVGMMAVTYLPRVLPIVALSSKDLSPSLVKWLECIPAAVLAAMLLPSLILDSGELNLRADNIYIWAAIPTLVVAKLGKSFVGAILVGMGVVAVARLLGFS